MSSSFTAEKSAEYELEERGVAVLELEECHGTNSREGLARAGRGRPGVRQSSSWSAGNGLLGRDGADHLA